MSSTSLFSTDELLTSTVRGGQIIVAALLLGVIGFLAFALVSGKSGPLQLPLVGLAVLFTVSGLVSREIVSRQLVQSQRRKLTEGTWRLPKNRRASAAKLVTEGDKLLSVYQTRLIVRSALVEGPIFLWGFLYLITAEQFVLGICGVLLGVLAAGFPRQERVIAWVREQLALLEQERSLPKPNK